MPDAANLNLDCSLDDDDAIFSFMEKQRTAFGAGRSFDPQKRCPTSHIGGQQFVVDVGAWKRELLPLRPADNGNRPVRLTGVFEQELARRYAKLFRQTAKRAD